MFLIKIFGNHKTADLNIEIRYKDIVSVMSSIEKIDIIISALEHINQPITMDLSSILQLACQYSLTADTVEYLLKLNANPNYRDANGCDAYCYVDDNNYPDVRDKMKALLNKYKHLFPEEDKQARKDIGWDFLYKEQLKYYEQMLK